MKLNRREMLRAVSGALAGISSASILGAHGALSAATTYDGEPRYFVFCYFSGAWDLLLALDPRDPAQFNAGNARTTRIDPGYERLPTNRRALVNAGGISFGPYIGKLAQHASKLCVVRGLSMETLTHDAGRRRFLTGRVPSGVVARGSSASTWLAAVHGEHDPVPQISMGVETYNRDQPSYATAISARRTSDLVDTLRASTARMGSGVEQALEGVFTGLEECAPVRRSVLLRHANEARERAARMTSMQLDRKFDFTANTAEMRALRQAFEFDLEPAQVRAALDDPEAQAALAAVAITQGVSRCVSIVAARGLDTHGNEWASNQGPSQERGFDAIANLATYLDNQEHPTTGKSYLEHTTIVGFSEFGRTAMLNASNGRDHSLTNGCFLLGGDVRGGQALGRSSDLGMGPVAVDLGTGRPSATGTVMSPEHVWQALFQRYGIGDEADLRVSPLRPIFRT